MASTSTVSWWAAFPEPKSSCSSLENTRVKSLVEEALSAGSGTPTPILLVDVRRDDWNGGTVATSINLPAQSFYPTRPVVYRLCKQAGIKQVIFYCGSSGGRGTRCANWMQDYLNEVGDQEMEAVIMKGGIKGWHKSFGGQLMDAYDEHAWQEKSQ